MLSSLFCWDGCRENTRVNPDNAVLPSRDQTPELSTGLCYVRMVSSQLLADKERRVNSDTAGRSAVLVHPTTGDISHHDGCSHAVTEKWGKLPRETGVVETLFE